MIQLVKSQRLHNARLLFQQRCLHPPKVSRHGGINVANVEATLQASPQLFNKEATASLCWRSLSVTLLLCARQFDPR